MKESFSAEEDGRTAPDNKVLFSFFSWREVNGSDPLELPSKEAPQTITTIARRQASVTAA